MLSVGSTKWILGYIFTRFCCISVSCPLPPKYFVWMHFELLKNQACTRDDMKRPFCPQLCLDSPVENWQVCIWSHKPGRPCTEYALEKFLFLEDSLFEGTEDEKCTIVHASLTGELKPLDKLMTLILKYDRNFSSPRKHTEKIVML